MLCPKVDCTTAAFFLLLSFLVCACNNADKEPEFSNYYNQKTQQILNDSANVFNQAGIDAYMDDSIEKALSLYDSAIAIRKNVLLNSNDFYDKEIKFQTLDGIIKGHQNKSLCYLYFLGDLPKAEAELLQSLEYLKKFEEEWDYNNPKRKAKIYQVLAQLYSDKQYLGNALACYYQSANNFLLADDSLGYAGTLNDISLLYIIWQQPDSIIKYSSMSLEILGQLKNEDITIFEANVHNNLGLGLCLNNDWGESIPVFDTALKLFSLYPEKSVIDIVKILHNKAFSFRLNGDLPKAHHIINQSIRINSNQSYSYKQKLLLASNYSNKADIYYDQKDYPNALVYYDKSIIQFLGEKKSFEITKLQPSAAEVIISDKIGFLEAFAGRAKTLAAMDQIKASLDTYDKSIDLINHVRRNYRDAQSKIRLAEITKRIFEGAIQVSLESGDIEKGLEYAEKSKGFTLMESLKHNQAVEQAINDEAALEQERELRKNIRDIEQEYAMESKPEVKAELLEKRQVYQNRLDDLLDQLSENEAYRQLMAEFPVLSSKQIQDSLLAEDQALVEYFVGDDSTYIFFIPKSGKIEAETLDKGRSALNREVKKLIYAIYPEDNEVQEASDTLLRTFDEAADSAYATQAFALYHELLKPVIARSAHSFKRLIIIPDDVLGYVPFDALLTSDTIAPGQYRDFDYLGKKYPVSYCYSAALLREMQSHQHLHSTKNKMLAFAHAQSAFQIQLKNLKRLFNAFWGNGPGFVKPLSDHPNPKAYLEKHAGNYRILHYSTHGEVNDREPNYSYLRMLPYPSSDPDSIYQLYEIFNTPIQAELVVTSACNTGIGKLFRGEGIMSLARGFSYAGASSIVTTLWAVQTEESNTLLNHFYQNLQKGMTKDEALYQAKRSFLKHNNSQQQDYHPVYWAGFIPVGDMTSMELPKAPSPVLMALKGGVLLMLLLLVVRFFRKKRS